MDYRIIHRHEMHKAIWERIEHYLGGSGGEQIAYYNHRYRQWVPDYGTIELLRQRVREHLMDHLTDLLDEALDYSMDPMDLLAEFYDYDPEPESWTSSAAGGADDMAEDMEYHRRREESLR